MSNTRKNNFRKIWDEKKKTITQIDIIKFSSFNLQSHSETLSIKLKHNNQTFWILFKQA
jgi:hypothetical protein